MTEMSGQTGENRHRTIFLSVTKEHEKRGIRPSLKCRSGGDQFEDVQTDIFSSLPIPWKADTPENVMKNDDFYRARKRKVH